LDRLLAVVTLTLMDRFLSHTAPHLNLIFSFVLLYSTALFSNASLGRV